ncbi:MULTISPECIES: DUF937 domain-containing protein [unclassified Flavobacterium]|uniref:DUF937 domain-containing protein n=1 Tax=unclassified Flavobacterium TaxID=196869 RepID=UPI000F0C8644|nr:MULTISPECIES: DUF937 domain-containing protein [unclassified Flavobacterium]AYN05455.1 hypothetical protein EAG11_15845 [Flavobacterium sp. 140616W15]MCD0473389.1 DUF937 domain-containing protein [Flavobacterium sp. EDS]
MNPNLQIELRRFISSNVVSKLNKFYFENDALLIKAIDASIGTILIGAHNKIHDGDLYNELIDIVEVTEFYKEIDFESGRLLSVNDCYKNEGNKLLKRIFDNKKSRITEMVSNEIGIKSETAREVLNFSALLVFSYFNFKKQVQESLQSTLEEQKRGILNSIPLGIKIILGFSSYEVVEEKSKSKFSNSIFNHIFSNSNS